MPFPTAETMAALALAGSDLIDALDEIYPEHSPEGHETERELWMRAGERRLVRRLLQHREHSRQRGV